MDVRVLTVFLSLCSSGLWADTVSPAPVPDKMRLVSGGSSCSGTLEVFEGGWRKVYNHHLWNLTQADETCRRLDCGSARSLQRHEMAKIENTNNKFVQRKPLFTITITCSDSIRLVGGVSRCSGRLEVKSGQSWSSVCADRFHPQDAEVACRELGCGPSALIRAERHKGQMSRTVFGCKGDESALSSCGSSDADACSSGKVAALTCSESDRIRLVQGASRCAGRLEMMQFGEWRPVDSSWWHLKLVDSACRQLDCGIALSTTKKSIPYGPVWEITWKCVVRSLEECSMTPINSAESLEITCSDTIRLRNGANMCSGRLEVKSKTSWSTVCEDGFGRWDAQVACRQLSCGPPSAFSGGLFGEAACPFSVSKFQCDGSESALQDCELESPGDTCSPGRALGLICSDGEEIKLVDGENRCAGQVVLKHNGDTRPVTFSLFSWSLMESKQICKRLDCGSVVSLQRKKNSGKYSSTWLFYPPCLLPDSTLKECVIENDNSSGYSLEITCSASVRLVGGLGSCSGRLEVQSGESWSSLCGDDFDLQDAAVVCREIRCGAPLNFGSGLHGGAEDPVWTQAFQCRGNESTLLECGRSGVTRTTCSPREAAGLTCSEPDAVRLVGSHGRCMGTLEAMHHGEWRPVDDVGEDWSEASSSAVCRQLGCGSALSIRLEEKTSDVPIWGVDGSCVSVAFSLRECLLWYANTWSFLRMELICSDFLARPNISSSVLSDGVSQQQGHLILRGSSFVISCSVEPQFPEGVFQLVFSGPSAVQNHTLPAANHSATFLFTGADHAHRGDYRCVYHTQVSSTNISSQSLTLHLAIGVPLTELFIRLSVHLLAVSLLIAGSCLYVKIKTRRGQELVHERSIKLEKLN